MVEQYKTNVKEIENDLKENKSGGDEQKYEILYQKEKEIDEFTVKYEEEKVEYERQIKDNQTYISQLLEKMHSNLARQNDLPSSKKVDEMKDDLKHKEG